MAYTPVPTVNSGDLWTAANHNLYIKDNITALYDMMRAYPVSAKRNAVQSIPSGTVTKLQFDTEVFDPDSCFTTGADAKYTAPVAGYYCVAGELEFSSGAGWDSGEFAGFYIYKNNSSLMTLAGEYQQATHSNAIAIRGTVFVQLAASDYLDFRCSQTAGTRNATSEIYIWRVQSVLA